MDKISYDRHRFPGIVIQQAVWLYFRFALSYRDVEDMLAERGIDVTYETVRANDRGLRSGRPARAGSGQRCRDPVPRSHDADRREEEVWSIGQSPSIAVQDEGACARTVAVSVRLIASSHERPCGQPSKFQAEKDMADGTQRRETSF